jgi:hypothetical protein
VTLLLLSCIAALRLPTDIFGAKLVRR